MNRPSGHIICRNAKRRLRESGEEGGGRGLAIPPPSKTGLFHTFVCRQFVLAAAFHSYPLSSLEPLLPDVPPAASRQLSPTLITAAECTVSKPMVFTNMSLGK